MKSSKALFNFLTDWREQILVLVLPRDQEVLVFEEQGLGDDVFMSPQPVQSTFVDDVPHDHVCVLQRQETITTTLRPDVTSNFKSRLQESH